MAKKATALVGEREEKRDIKIDGKCKSVKIRPSIWNHFVKLANAHKLTNEAAAKLAQRECNGSLKEAIEKWVRSQVDVIYSFENRETWLNALVEAMKPEFEARDCPLTRPVRVSLGFPSTGARGKRIGECWPSTMSKDGVNEIFITPFIDNPIELADILTHELVHAWDDCKSGHKAKFKNGGARMGLRGKATCMYGRGNEAWDSWALPLLEGVGPCPHAALDKLPSKKKQTTRMLKVQCPCCDFTFRAAKTTIEEACCTHGEDGKLWLQCPSPTCSTKIHPFGDGDTLEA